MNRGVVLLILDGWGIAPSGLSNAISLARTPNFDLFWNKYPHTLLSASGSYVGLPDGQMGNSEVGHLNIGGGRIIWQDLPRITNSIKDKSYFSKKAFLNAIKNSKENNTKLHLIGLVSPGGVHSHQEHLFALIKLSKERGVKDLFIHVITDGRDVPPKSAISYIEELEKVLTDTGIGKIGTVSGRYYSMDRDNRWERVVKSYNALVLGRGEFAKDAKTAVEKSYKLDISDEFIIPTIVDENSKIEEGDSVIFFNFRTDRPRELVKSIILPNFPGFKREKTLNNLYFVTMTEYEKGLPVSEIAFETIEVANNLSEVIANEGLKQFHIAETEKYAHVTFFFNGGKEKPLVGEDRLMVPSPKVSTYDLKPEMSAGKIATEVTERMGRYDFMVINFANLDMVGHTGKIKETIKAAETVDACLGGVVMAAKTANYDVVIIADHGNAEKMINADGNPCTSHTTNPVPFILVSNDNLRIRHLLEPKLGNVGPTILQLLGIKKPKEMTEKSLIAD